VSAAASSDDSRRWWAWVVSAAGVVSVRAAGALALGGAIALHHAWDTLGSLNRNLIVRPWAPLTMLPADEKSSVFGGTTWAWLPQRANPGHQWRRHRHPVPDPGHHAAGRGMLGRIGSGERVALSIPS
jgi:hypothetical protein